MLNTFILRNFFFFPSINSRYPPSKGLKKRFSSFLTVIFYFCHCTVYGIVFLRYHLQAHEGALVAFLLISHQGFWGSCTSIVHVCVSVYYIVLSVVLAQYTLTPLDCFCWVMFVQCIHLQQSKSRSSVLLFSFYYPSPRLFFLPFAHMVFLSPTRNVLNDDSSPPSSPPFSHMCQKVPLCSEESREMPFEMGLAFNLEPLRTTTGTNTSRQLILFICLYYTILFFFYWQMLLHTK